MMTWLSLEHMTFSILECDQDSNVFYLLILSLIKILWSTSCSIYDSVSTQIIHSVKIIIEEHDRRNHTLLKSHAKQSKHWIIWQFFNQLRSSAYFHRQQDHRIWLLDWSDRVRISIEAMKWWVLIICRLIQNTAIPELIPVSR